MNVIYILNTFSNLSMYSKNPFPFGGGFFALIPRILYKRIVLLQ
ncbi:hypothetical protein CH06_gp23 [Bacillus phage phiCM3]|uniref:Uncharacterized protein n=1 Tax=Bacillus phage phiCM3 TaxID=1357713 RepID=W8CYZ1_9CAUD|nr:hypothetical protein CH06_gp23 [Bacillus phage phiCM3]AGV99451.1 hypothetical protein phiCM3_gp23 [Bacillus phage phiCM3]